MNRILYYYPGNASLLPHMMLREIGAEFTLRLVDRAQHMQKSPDYLKLNPNGRIPVLIDGDLVLFETAAIAIWLAETHPEARLAPPPGTSEHAIFTRWMVHLTNTPQVEYRAWFYPEEYVADPALATSVKKAAGARLEAIFDRIAAQLDGRDWLLSSGFSAADLFLFMLVRWGRGMPRPPRELAPLAAHAGKILARRRVQETLAAEGITAPFV